MQMLIRRKRKRDRMGPQVRCTFCGWRGVYSEAAYKPRWGHRCPNCLLDLVVMAPTEAPKQ
jgi:hypothetical protein